mgnify:CR=1 FL=1
MDLTVFLSPETWVSFATLLFLEIILGIDNIVFIILTIARLPENEQHLGRKIGLLGALISRCAFLCFASFLVHMTSPLVTIDQIVMPSGEAFSLSMRDLVLLVGGAYLIHKGIDEIREMFSNSENSVAGSIRENTASSRTLNPEPIGDSVHKTSVSKTSDKGAISFVGAIITIMIMDVVFSIDSVITAVGLADQLIVMIVAVIVALLIMMIFIDKIGDLIECNPEMKLLALAFIVAIGVLLVLDGIGLRSGIEICGIELEKLCVYSGMIMSVATTGLQIALKNDRTLVR